MAKGNKNSTIKNKPNKIIKAEIVDLLHKYNYSREQLIEIYNQLKMCEEVNELVENIFNKKNTENK